MNYESVEIPTIITRVSERNLTGLKKEAKRVGIKIRVLGSERQGRGQRSKAGKGRIFIQARSGR